MPRTKDMTKGSPVKLIVAFALPVLAGNALQQLYSLVDSLIIGQLLGVTALTAISASGWLDWAVLSIPMGFAQGFSVYVAQCFGGRDSRGLKRGVAQSGLIACGVTLGLEALSQLLLHPVLVWMNSPQQTILLTENYLRIIFAGLPIVMAVNVLSGFLHALGNSHTPLWALAASALVNIALDWWFVGGLGWGTNGGAYATVIAQGISALICLQAVVRIPALHPGRADWRMDGRVIKKLLKLGFPLAFQNCVISLGGLVLQGIVNAYGFIFMAGYNAASRLQGLVELAGASLGNAVGTFTAQNVGAGQPRRVRLGLRRSAQLSVALALAVAGLMIGLGRPLLLLFIRADAETAGQVLSVGYDFLQVMSFGLPALYLLFTYRFTLQGLGNTLIPMASGFVELAFRIACILLLPGLLGVLGVYMAEISAWIGAGIFLMIGCYRKLRRAAHRR